MVKIEIFGIPYLKKGSGIHIKKKNRGKFTEYCGGEVTNECILKAKKSKNPKLRKRATFAANARKWKHENGGVLKYQLGTTSNGINLFTGHPNPNLYYHPDIAADNPEIAKINEAHDFQLLRYSYSPEKLSGFTDGQHLRILEARRHLINKGLNDNLIYALFGNIMKESSFNPNAVLQGGDNAVGYFLMHGDRLNDFNRWKKQQKQLSAFPEIDYFLDIINSGNDIYTNDYNTSKDNVTNSYNALLDSIKNNKGVALATNEYNKYKKYHDDVYGHRENNNTLYLIGDFLKAWNDPNSSTEELTNLFEKTFEKAGTPETDKRIEYATTFLLHYTPQSMKKGNKIHKPFGHRSILDNGWQSTKLLRGLKNIYGL